MSKNIDAVLELIDASLPQPQWLLTRVGDVAHLDEGFGLSICRIGRRLYHDTATLAASAPRCKRCLSKLSAQARKDNP